MFDITGDDLKVTEQAPEPKRPYAGKMTLIEVNRNNPSRQEGKSYDVVQFHFRIDEGEEAGKIYRHIEWDPIRDDRNDEENAKKAKNLAKRVAFMMAYFIDGDREEAKAKAAQVLSGLKSWKEFTAKTHAAFESLGYAKKDDLRGKILGSVYMGRPSLGFPNYLGFLSDSRSDFPVDFTNKETQQNAEYLMQLGATPDAVDDIDGGGSTAGGPLEF